MTSQPLRVAAVQAESRAGDVEHNVATVVAWIEKAATERAALVVFPELFLPGYDMKTLADAPDGCDVTLDDVRLAPIAAAAEAGTLATLVSASVRRPDGSRSLAVLSFAPTGEVHLAYVKQHLWEDERTIFTPGEQGASVVLGGWDLGLGICYDGCFPEHARAAADAGALVYVCPSAYVVGSEHRRDLYYAARAIDNSVYVVFAGLVGRCGDHDFSGGTAVYDPQGRVVERVEAGEGMVVVDLDPARIDEARSINPYERDRVVDGAERLVLTLE